MRSCALWLMVLSVSLFTLGCQPTKTSTDQPSDQPSAITPTTEGPATLAAEPVEEPGCAVGHEREGRRGEESRRREGCC